MGDGDKPVRGDSDAGLAATAADAAPRTRTETATLACAVTVAVALGVACGIWINSRLAASAAARRAAPMRLTSGTRAETPPAVEARDSRASVETANAAPLNKEPTATTAEAHEPKQSPAARGASPQSKPKARLVASFVTRESTKQEEEEQARPAAPCAPYASAGSLNMHSGGAAFLVVGGPGETGPVTVTTESWADIAIMREGQAANGWVRYAVKSIGHRPGLYTIQFSTRCGSQTIPVTVK